MDHPYQRRRARVWHELQPIHQQAERGRHRDEPQGPRRPRPQQSRGFQGYRREGEIRKRVIVTITKENPSLKRGWDFFCFVVDNYCKQNLIILKKNTTFALK